MKEEGNEKTDDIKEEKKEDLKEDKIEEKEDIKEYKPSNEIEAFGKNVIKKETQLEISQQKHQKKQNLISKKK